LVPAPPDLDELLGLADEAARAAGALLLRGLAAGPTGIESKSTRTDAVSDVDRASEALILERIGHFRPHDGFLAEEGSHRRGTSGVRWVVDPLDGTVNYLYGLPDFAVSIAAEVDGLSVVGVVHCPSRDETFRATVEGGAWLDNRRLEVNQGVEAALALIGTGFAYESEVRAEQGRLVARLLPEVRDIRRAGSAALDLCSVAAGRLDAYFERGTKAWDRAAGGLVAAEAGAAVSDLTGAAPNDAMVLAAAPGLARTLRQMLGPAPPG
jgi:myo-inositol-1(or 4)-monophosphatase